MVILSEKLQLLEKYVGKIVSQVSLRSWGDLAGYGLDLDGHLIAFAKNPKN
ncbi:MAG: hypothetical protein ACTSVU_01645 [Promethearchaeota archaeon]